MQKTKNNDQVLDASQVFRALEQSLAIIEFDLNGRVLGANHHFAAAMEYHEEDMAGRGITGSSAPRILPRAGIMKDSGRICARENPFRIKYSE